MSVRLRYILQLKQSVEAQMFDGLDFSSCYLLHTGFLLRLFFYPEYGGSISLRNVDRLSTIYTALYPRR
jgi:hypothetical protein